MAKRTAVAKALDDISEAVPHLIRLPERRAWIDYDKEADVLYISLKRPQAATDTKFLADKGILLRYRAKDLVGVTVLDASKPRKRRRLRELAFSSRRFENSRNVEVCLTAIGVSPYT